MSVFGTTTIYIPISEMLKCRGNVYARISEKRFLAAAGALFLGRVAWPLAPVPFTPMAATAEQGSHRPRRRALPPSEETVGSC